MALVEPGRSMTACVPLKESNFAGICSPFSPKRRTNDDPSAVVLPDEFRAPELDDTSRWIEVAYREGTGTRERPEGRSVCVSTAEAVRLVTARRRAGREGRRAQ